MISRKKNKREDDRMSFLERTGNLFKEIAWILLPEGAGDWGWLFFALFLGLVFLCRDVFGGFWKSLWSLAWLAAFLLFLNSISPWLVLCFLVAGTIVFAIRNK